jgi:RNA polymerase-binding transcription factor DksA
MCALHPLFIYEADANGVFGHWMKGAGKKMRIFRKKLERQKTVLAKRLEKNPSKESRRPRTMKAVRRFGTKMRRKLLYALASQQMEEVRDAIERLDDGVYGICFVCGQEIAPNRLQVMPTATYCWACQQDKTAQKNALSPYSTT